MAVRAVPASTDASQAEGGGTIRMSTSPIVGRPRRKLPIARTCVASASGAPDHRPVSATASCTLVGQLSSSYYHLTIIFI